MVSSDVLRFDTSLLLVNVTLQGYLISIAYCLFFILYYYIVHLTCFSVLYGVVSVSVLSSSSMYPDDLTTVYVAGWPPFGKELLIKLT